MLWKKCGEKNDSFNHANSHRGGKQKEGGPDPSVFSCVDLAFAFYHHLDAIRFASCSNLVAFRIWKDDFKSRASSRFGHLGSIKPAHSG